ncbi:MAG: hypothetical protein WD042_05125 [Phycisphaeraceae bacterium]
MPGGWRGGPPWGELLTNPKHYRADMVLIAQAAREGWPVPAQTKHRLVERVAALLSNPSWRVRLRAIKTLLAMDGGGSADGRGDAGVGLAGRRWRSE